MCVRSLQFEVRPTENLKSKKSVVHQITSEETNKKIDQLCASFKDLKEDATDYNSRVPVIIGTNVINLLLQDDLCTQPTDNLVWETAVRSAAASKQSVAEDGKISSIQCMRQTVIPPQSQVNIRGSTRLGPTGKVLVMAEEGEYSNMPAGLVIAPTIHSLVGNSKSATRVSVGVTNTTTKAVTIPAKTTLCDLFQVSLIPGKPGPVDPVIEKGDQKESNSAKTIKVQQVIHTDDNQDKSPESLFLDKFKLEATDLDDSQKTQVESLLLKWKHVFAESDLDLGWTKTVQHDINLTDNQPFKERYHRLDVEYLLTCTRKLDTTYKGCLIAMSYRSVSLHLLLQWC